MLHLWDGWSQVVANCYKKLTLSDSLCTYPAKIRATYTSSDTVRRHLSRLLAQGVAGRVLGPRSGSWITHVSDMGLHCAQGMVRALCTHQPQPHSQVSRSFPSSHTAKGHSPLHQAPPKASPPCTLPLAKLLTVTKTVTSCHLKCSRLIGSSASQPTSASEPQQHTWSCQLGYSSGHPSQASYISHPSWMRFAVISLHQAHDHFQVMVPYQPWPATRCTWPSLTPLTETQMLKITYYLPPEHWSC